MDVRDLDPANPAPGIKRFTVPLVFPSPDHLHVHVLSTPDGDLVVDCGARGSEAALAAGLERTGANVDRVLVTHGHVDHWGLAATLTDAVLAHPGVLPAFRWGTPEERPIDYGPGAPAAALMHDAFTGYGQLHAGIPEIEPLAHRDRIGDWEVLATPGHDPGHLCLFRESDGVLLCGDLLLPGFTPNVQPAWDRSDALADFLDSLARMAELPVRLVLPAHGEPYTDAAARADELRRHHETRLQILRRAVRDNPRSIDELRAAAFATTFPSPPDAMLAEMETYAHADHLRRRGELAFENDRWWSVA